jgi:hypothetical protein
MAKEIFAHQFYKLYQGDDYWKYQREITKCIPQMKKKETERIIKEEKRDRE